MTDNGKNKGAKKKFVYYPGCSSQGSSRHLDQSLRAIIPVLGLEMEEIDDWNCCGASVGNIGGGSLPTAALSGRNLAKAEQQQATDVITGCAACYLNTHGANEKIKADIVLRGKVNESLAAADMSYEGNLQVRHVCEVIVNDVGIDKIKEMVTNPLEGLKVAGYVGCQTVRPFANADSGGNFDTYDDPEFLDQFTEACGAEAVDYQVKTSCCGGSVSVISPEKNPAPDQGNPAGRAGCRGRRHLHALPVVPDQRGNVPAHDQQKIRYRFQHTGGFLQPAYGQSLWPGRQKRSRPAPQHHPFCETGYPGQKRLARSCFILQLLQARVLSNHRWINLIGHAAVMQDRVIEGYCKLLAWCRAKRVPAQYPAYAAKNQIHM